MRKQSKKRSIRQEETKEEELQGLFQPQINKKSGDHSVKERVEGYS